MYRGHSKGLLTVKLLGIVLLALSLFMLVGFGRSGADIGSPATIAALLITVVLPAAGGVALLTSPLRRGGRLSARKELLRQQTLDAEILRLAAQRDGRLTAVEVATEFAIPPETAKELLDAFTIRDVADIQVTDSGVIVYAFHDIKHLADKPHAKGVLDA
jgi:uncharacterized membrane protein